jgi:peptidoglycan/xylan/chitin deacetylase (PgdA/CDA1 family)
MLPKVLKKIIKKTAFSFAYAMGVDRWFQKKSDNNKLIVMYHGVSTCNCLKINGRHLPMNEFEKHVIYYKKYFNIVSLNELALMRQKNQVSTKPTIALTFDDGFVNNLDNVPPILEKYETPATFFVTTLPVQQNNHILNSEILEMGCAYFAGNEVNLGGVQFKKHGQYKWLSKEGQTLYDFLQRQNNIQKHKFIEEWTQQYNLQQCISKTDKQCIQLMGEKELTQLALSPLVEIASHTHSHPYLTLLDDNELITELEVSKHLLEKISHSKVESIAFPDGVYDERVLNFCRKAGYKNLVSVGLNKQEDKLITDLFPRVGSSNSDGIAFNMITISRFFNILGF